MYVCNCNGITERMVSVALKAGAQTWDEVHAHFECTPCCGKCSTELSATIRQHRKSPLDSAKTLSDLEAPVLVGSI